LGKTGSFSPGRHHKEKDIEQCRRKLKAIRILMARRI
jgi:hypothetical protein